MNIKTVNDRSLDEAAEILKKGGVVAFPTETVYGLGADALNPSAAAKIFEVKQRPLSDPLIVHISRPDMIEYAAENIPQAAERLMERFWPGPLTFVLRKKSSLPDIVTSGLDSVAVRMPAHVAALNLIEKAGTPIAAPSANLFGRLSPTTAAHVHEQLGEKIDLILDGGTCSVGVESTILKVEGNRFLILRPGGIPLNEIEEIAGCKLITLPDSGEAPGSFPSHYAPVSRLIIVENIDRKLAWESGAAFLFYRKPDFLYDASRSAVLSEKGDIREAAVNLFSSLHRLDAMKPECIYTETVPEKGLGVAVMDRLRKASRRRPG